MRQKITMANTKEQNLLLKALKGNTKGLTASEAAKATGLDITDVVKSAKDLFKQGQLEYADTAKTRIRITAEEEEEAPKPKPRTRKAKPASAPEPEPEFDMEEDDEEIVPEEEEEEEVGFEDDTDDEFDADNDEEHDPIEPEEEESPKPKPRKKKAEAVPFSIAFKPIDTLTTEELEERIAQATELAEYCTQDPDDPDVYYPLAAEMMMRSVAKARKQLAKRQG